MNRNVRAMLNEIDAFLVKYSKHKAAKELWNVLSALRGPDVKEDQGAKDGATNVIRTSAFPRTAKNERRPRRRTSIPASFAPDKSEVVTLPPKRGVYGDGHFRSHIRAAAKALGLETRETPSFIDLT